jgi:hypothetical protein
VRHLQIWIGVAYLAGWLLLVAGCGQDLWWTQPFGTDDITTIAAGGTGGSSTTSTGEGGEGGTFPTTGTGGNGTLCMAQMGECVRYKTDEFQGVAMYFIGPPEKALPCPESAPHPGTTHWGQLQNGDPLACPSCSCSVAACALPEAMRASSAPCADPNAGQPTPFDAPIGWTEGVCTDENAIPAGAQCGGAFCVESLVIEAPHVEPCVASADAEVGTAPLSWEIVAQECSIEPLSREDCDNGEGCAPSPPPGFRLCLYRDGDVPELACPDPYTDQRFVVYLGATDTRGCSPCECGDPEGVECIAEIAVFTDGACGVPFLPFPVPTTKPESCFDLPEGTALGSKEGSFLVHTPGKCAPSESQPIGEVMGTAPMTLCCKRPTPPDPP